MADANYEWKHAFKKNRVKIVKGLANPDAVAGQLFQSAILNSEMHELIVQMEEREQKTRKILDTLNYRGKAGVAALHDAFMETENKDLANVLAPYVIAVAKIASKTEPNEWPPTKLEDTAMTKEHVIEIKDKNSPWFVHEYGKESVYDMKGECRGQVFIINNVLFGKKMGSRTSSATDANNLSLLFKELHFTVKQWNNLTAKQMESNLCSAADEIQEKKNTECVVLIILSHGGGTRIYGVDCMPVELKTLTDCFSTAKCQTLHGKPRLVFVQACRSVEIATIEETSHVAKLHTDVTFECIINTNQPILEMSWARDVDGAEQNIKDETSSNKYRRENRQNLERLIVNKVEENDKGKYKCVVKYESEYRTNPSELKLDVEDVEKASMKRTVHSVRPGTSEVKIECTVRTDKPIKEVFWEKDAEGKNGNGFTYRDTKISEKYRLDSHMYGKTSTKSLTIKEVRASDQGKYRCIIQYNDNSKDISNLTELEVDLQGVEIAKIKKTIHVVEAGGQVEIKCNVETDKPISAVFWEKDAGNVKNIITEKTNPDKYFFKINSVGKTRSLIINNVDRGDIGNYRCIVKYESIYTSNPTELELDAKDEDASDVKEKSATSTQEACDELDSEPYKQKPVEKRVPKPTFLDHPSSDFLIAYATPEDTKAWLHGTVGSWFMNAIVWTFKYHAHEEELHHLLIRVNRLVGKGCTWSNEMTVAEVKSNLRKKLYFFPGIYGYPPELFKEKKSE